MGVDRDDAVYQSGDETAGGLLADSFSGMEGCILTHVAEIRSEKHKVFCAPAP